MADKKPSVGATRAAQQIRSSLGALLMGDVHFAAIIDAEVAPLVEALKALPLEEFDKGMEDCDAADFVDHAGEFFEAMVKARTTLAAWEGRS